MSRAARSSLAFAGALALCACNLSASEDASVELDQQSGSFGLVSIERFVDSESQPRLLAGAKVARFRGIPGDELLHLLGAQPRDLESCKLEGGLHQLSIDPEARVDLLAIGDISVRLGESLTTLSPRVFPALASTASGYFYAGDAEVVVPRAELDEYLISARGEAGAGAFELVAPAPGEVLGLGLEGSRLENEIAVTREHSLALTWEPEDIQDRIELELYAGGSMLSCAFRDDGHFVLDAGMLAGLEADEHGSMVVRRVRNLPVELAGIEAGSARIATTRTLEAVVR